MKATPESFAPYLARGSYGVALAMRAEAANTWQIRGVRCRGDAAEPPLGDGHLVKARTLRPKLVAAMREQLRLLALSSTGIPEAGKFNEALVVCPSCFRIRAKYLNFARPRWGGSYEEMEDFARAVDDQRWPRLHALRGYVDEDRASCSITPKTSMRRWPRAIARARKEMRQISSPRARKSRWRVETRAGAIANLDRADAILPGDVATVLPLRAWARAKTAIWFSPAPISSPSCASTPPTTTPATSSTRWFAVSSTRLGDLQGRRPRPGAAHLRPGGEPCPH